MEKSGTCTGPTIAGISREEQSVRFDILSLGSKVNTRFYLWLRWSLLSLAGLVR